MGRRRPAAGCSAGKRGTFPRPGRAIAVFVAGVFFIAMTAVSGCISGRDKSAGMSRYIRYAPGFYEGIGRGYQGRVHVMVQIGSGGILGIEILDHGDDELVGGAAMEELLELVLEANSTELDAVSGATGSSAGFLEAVEDALTRAAGI
jgi:uncharacterized protein with FMN-binding domain